MSRAWGWAALAAVPVLAVSGCLGALLLVPPAAPAAGCLEGPALPTDPAALPQAPVAGYDAEQLTNAARVMAAAEPIGLGVDAQVLAVMTAMGESSLRVLPYGDDAGPDSRGLFQQRANGAWGTEAERMDPTASANRFYQALAAVPGWQDLPPSIAAHRVQANADPHHYEPHLQPATEVAAALTAAATAAAGLPPAAQEQAPPTPAAPPAGPTPALAGCAPPAAIAVGPGGWVRPVTAPVTSSYGPRVHPVSGRVAPHAGTDLGAPCGTPILAAADGRVVRAGPAAGYGNLIVVDHGGGTTTSYAHMWAEGVLAAVGATVAAGQQIGTVGEAGTSTACHLHLEVTTDGRTVDPETHFAAHGAALS